MKRTKQSTIKEWMNKWMNASYKASWYWNCEFICNRFESRIHTVKKSTNTYLFICTSNPDMLYINVHGKYCPKNSFPMCQFTLSIFVVWTLSICFCRILFVEAEYSQTEHLYRCFFFFSWTELKWYSKWLLRLKAWSQIVQANGLVPSWTVLMCFVT